VDVYYNKGWQYKLVVKKDSPQPNTENQDDIEDELEDVNNVPFPKEEKKLQDPLKKS
jgi:hypothetical protein